MTINKAVRAVFVSDLHLGSGRSQPAAFADFLDPIVPEYLYLAGDIIDGWRLPRMMCWDESINRVISRIAELIRHGTRVVYLPGNHDQFVRSGLFRHPRLEITESVVHVSALGWKIAVIHGDQFDSIECRAQWLSKMGCWFSDQWTRRQIRFDRAAGSGRQASQSAKPALPGRLLRQALGSGSLFRKRSLQFARDCQATGVICGHLHQPELRSVEDFHYMNTGDWVSNQSAILELACGEFQLVNFGKVISVLPGPRVMPDQNPGQRDAAETACVSQLAQSTG